MKTFKIPSFFPIKIVFDIKKEKFTCLTIPDILYNQYYKLIYNWIIVKRKP